MTVSPASCRSCSVHSFLWLLLCSPAMHLIFQPQLMFISFFWDCHKCRNCYRKGIYGLFLFLRWVGFFSKTDKASFLLNYLNPLNFLVLSQISPIFFCYVLALGGSYSPDKAQFLLLRNQIHFLRSNCMMKAFIFSAVMGQRDQRFQPFCHSPGLEHHQDHDTTLKRVNSHFAYLRSGFPASRSWHSSYTQKCDQWHHSQNNSLGK